jgi:hypothetical protein
MFRQILWVTALTLPLPAFAQDVALLLVGGAV